MSYKILTDDVNIVELCGIEMVTFIVTNFAPGLAFTPIIVNTEHWGRVTYQDGSGVMLGSIIVAR